MDDNIELQRIRHLQDKTAELNSVEKWQTLKKDFDKLGNSVVTLGLFQGLLLAEKQAPGSTALHSLSAWLLNEISGSSSEQQEGEMSLKIVSHLISCKTSTANSLWLQGEAMRYIGQAKLYAAAKCSMQRNDDTILRQANSNSSPSEPAADTILEQDT